MEDHWRILRWKLSRFISKIMNQDCCMNHAFVKKQFREKKTIYEFMTTCIVSCAREAGNAMELTASDFLNWKSGSSQIKETKESRSLFVDNLSARDDGLFI